VGFLILGLRLIVKAGSAEAVPQDQAAAESDAEA
jgi:hypothetical protein